MNGSPRDVMDSYLAVTPVNAKAYLLGKGWKQVDKVGDKALIFSNTKTGEHIMLPLKPSFADYAVRIAELVHSVSVAESRDPNWVLNDLKLSGFDVFRVRLIDNARNGTIPVSSTPDILDYARDMLVSAATAIAKPRYVLPPRKGADVDEFIGKVRLGQTEQGSYIFTLLVPVAPNFEEPLPLPGIDPIIIDDPFERKSTNMLNAAIHAAHDAANSYVVDNSLQSFKDAVSSGVSANFCEAMSSIVEKAGKTEFSLSWAMTRPKEVAASEAPTIVGFAMAEIIGEAARNFRATTPIGTTISGYITSLDKDKRDPLGNVVMKVTLDGKQRPVKLALTDEDYQIAYQAHQGYKTVIAQGVLVQRGMHRVLEKITSFSIELD